MQVCVAVPDIIPIQIPWIITSVRFSLVHYLKWGFQNRITGNNKIVYIYFEYMNEYIYDVFYYIIKWF